MKFLVEKVAAQQEQYGNLLMVISSAPLRNGPGLGIDNASGEFERMKVRTEGYEWI